MLAVRWTVRAESMRFVRCSEYLGAALDMTLGDFNPWQTSNSAYGEWWRESKAHVPQVNKDVAAAVVRKVTLIRQNPISPAVLNEYSDTNTLNAPCYYPY
eukprot:9102809-Pyramimonas_sp.AAC.1